MSDKPYHMHPYLVYLLIIASALFIVWSMKDDIYASHRMQEAADQTLVKIENIANSVNMKMESIDGTLIANQRELAGINSRLYELDPMYGWRVKISNEIAGLRSEINAQRR